MVEISCVKHWLMSRSGRHYRTHPRPTGSYRENVASAHVLAAVPLGKPRLDEEKVRDIKVIRADVRGSEEWHSPLRIGMCCGLCDSNIYSARHALEGAHWPGTKRAADANKKVHDRSLSLET